MQAPPREKGALKGERMSPPSLTPGSKSNLQKEALGRNVPFGCRTKWNTAGEGPSSHAASNLQDPDGKTPQPGRGGPRHGRRLQSRQWPEATFYWLVSCSQGDRLTRP